MDGVAGGCGRRRLRGVHGYVHALCLKYYHGSARVALPVQAYFLGEHSNRQNHQDYGGDEGKDGAGEIVEGANYHIDDNYCN